MIVSREIEVTDNSKLYVHNIYGTYLIFERNVSCQPIQNFIF